MSTIRTLTLALALVVPFLAAAPAAAQTVTDNGNGTVTLTAANGQTFTVNGQVNPDGTVTVQTPAGASVQLPASLVGQIADALAAGSGTAVGEAIADVIEGSSDLVASNPGLVAQIAALAAAVSPDNGDAIALGALQGAADSGVLGSNPALADQIVSSVEGAGASVSGETRDIAAAISGEGEGGGQLAGGGAEGGDETDAEGRTASSENPATESPDTEPGESPSET